LQEIKIKKIYLKIVQKVLTIKNMKVLVNNY